MVDSIRPRFRNIPPVTPAERIKKASDVQTATDDKEGGQAYVVTQDRRKGKDRRNKRDGNRPLYDMRSGRGRRKDDGDQPSIEIDV